MKEGGNGNKTGRNRSGWSVLFQFVQAYIEGSQLKREGSFIDASIQCYCAKAIINSADSRYNDIFYY